MTPRARTAEIAIRSPNSACDDKGGLVSLADSVRHINAITQTT
jgi:hypothetical protein